MSGVRNDRSNRSVSDYESDYALRKALMSMEAPQTQEDAQQSSSSQQQPNYNSNNGASMGGPTGVNPAASLVVETSESTVDGTASAAAAAAAAQETTSEQEDGKKKPPAAAAAASSTLSNSDKADLDWVLPTMDPETTEVQSMKQELQRLLVLKSYLILDSEREAAFERLTGLASRIFKVPIALVSVVDLGRQWFMSNHGLPENVRETPRRHAFCAHAIMSKEGMLVVPDATQDFRFKDNPLVTGPPNIRFYAGAVS